MSNLLKVTDSDFKKKVQDANLPAMVFFSATWNGVSRQMSPILDTLKDEYQGKLNFYEMDVDSNPATPGKFGVSSIPTMLIFENGKIVGTKIGSLPRSAMENFIDESL